jgi:dimethylhistidine N-methyltransferase
VDISAEFLREAASALGLEYPWLTVNAVCADFNGEWSFLDDLPQNKHVVFYPGSTLGNLEPAAARRFLRGMTEVVGTSGGVLIGVDRHKDRATLEAAYNDRDGVTAAFNLNILERFNALLDADFDATRFRHHAFYNESAHRIEMHLVSIGDQEVTAGGRRLRFADGETIHTENSYKYSDEDFSALAADAGFQVRHFWTDEDRLFGLYYLEHA